MHSQSGRGASRDARAGPTEITVSSDQGDHSTKVFRAAIQGDDLGTVEIKFVKGGKTYLTIKLHHAMISSFNVSGSGGAAHDRPMESWTLNGTKIEYEAEQGPAAGSPPG